MWPLCLPSQELLRSKPPSSPIWIGSAGLAVSISTLAQHIGNPACSAPPWHLFQHSLLVDLSLLSWIKAHQPITIYALCDIKWKYNNISLNFGNTSKKSVIIWYKNCANIIECTDTNLDSIIYFHIAYCSQLQIHTVCYHMVGNCNTKILCI